MKKLVAIILIVASIVVVTIIALGDKSVSNQYVRIHIRANSNSDIDKDIKYVVKDKVVEYLTPLILSSVSMEDFEVKLGQNIGNIVGITNNTLAQNNFDYKGTAFINTQYFPLRDYAGFTLKSGFYDALDITLGDGEGDNWWCVIYPPLCTSSDTNSIYRSRIIDFINNFFRREN